jgi:dienelactone hydrolase
VREQTLVVGDVPVALWTPDDFSSTTPLIFLGHGGGEHKKAPAMVERARYFAREGGFAVVVPDVPAHGDRPPVDEYQAIAAGNQARAEAGEPPAGLIAGFQALVSRQTVPEWCSVVDALGGSGPIGYWGVSLGCGLGVPFVAAEARVRAAVLGLGGAAASAGVAARITVPVRFLLQWDDERVPREQALALFDAFGSAEKTLHASPGPHAALPPFEMESSLRFFERHLR